MSSAQLSIALDLTFLAVVLALLWIGSRSGRVRRVLNFDLAPWLTRRSFDPQTGEPLQTWKGAAYIALTLFLTLNAVALVALSLAVLGAWDFGSQVAGFFAAFGLFGGIAIFLLQCPASFTRRH
jgi:small-conductance mechanosensitive channel